MVNRHLPSFLLLVSLAAAHAIPAPVPEHAQKAPNAWNSGSPSSPHTQQQLLRPRFSCDFPAPGLLAEDCDYMSAIGMKGQGVNNQTNNGRIWTGTDGPNLFTFVNAAQPGDDDRSVILIVWYMAPTDGYQASFMNARVPDISYSLPKRGDAITISMANGVAGGWSALYNHKTKLSAYGQINNTFGEFSTGDYATIDISRLVNMAGDAMTVEVPGGCVSDMTRCVYVCNSPAVNSCGDAGTYDLLKCDGFNAVQHKDPSSGEPTGGCQGWSFGGQIKVFLS
ncbi:hypothetical protein B0H63DRAFT_172621 [Podospora didyma]|uniref:Uncharacterized protein n=1 Tax=Podospora didyma TaxID=330526 RepID=A0AAE0NNN9_9PEZI|nr:hypothetical protein B0H63DRAFT_172621 [Podospora didyma]